MERSFGAMLRQLPGKTEVPNLLVDISQTGLAAGLQEKLFQPGSEKSNGFYAELPIKIRLVGSYHQFGSFVSGIAALPRIVTLHDIQITPVGDAKARLRQSDHGRDRQDLSLHRRRRRAKRRRRRRQEAQREEQERRAPDLRGRARELRGGRLLGRPIRSAEVDCRDQEEAGRAHPGAARGQALRNFHLQREQSALAVSTGGPERGAGQAERAARARSATANSSKASRSTR